MDQTLMQYSSTRYLVLLVFVGGLAWGANGQNTATAQLNRLVAESAVFKTGFTGFNLVDAQDGATLYAYQADAYFTPASNTKLFTFFLAWSTLRNWVPAVFYQEFDDKLLLWGTGYPLALHPDFVGYDQLTPWLKSVDKPTFLNAPAPHRIPRYGLGWSWDDYNYGYVYERSSLPLYANRLSISRELGQWGLTVYPPDFVAQLEFQNEPDLPTAIRPEFSNTFQLKRALLNQRAFSLRRAFVTSDALTANLLSTALERPIQLDTQSLAAQNAFSIYEVSFPDTVYQQLLRDSDNFLAEQLLILAAAQRYKVLDEQLIIDYAVDTLLAELELPRRGWVDGSGLSRYNQFTPRQLTGLLRRMYEEIGLQKMQQFLAVGGEAGTIKPYFQHSSGPYVWAKSGSLRNVLCLSGIVRTNSGKYLLFSFMHNNFPGKSREFYREMEKVMSWIHDNL